MERKILITNVKVKQDREHATHRCSGVVETPWQEPITVRGLISETARTQATYDLESIFRNWAKDVVLEYERGKVPNPLDLGSLPWQNVDLYQRKLNQLELE